jgi:hypothetical protein
MMGRGGSETMQPIRRQLCMLTALLAVALAVFMTFSQRTPAAAQGGPADAATLYRLFQSKTVKSIQFAQDGWGYHVEIPVPDRLYIAGVKGPNTQIAATVDFATRKTADLMIIACGVQFGDDGCDFYSPLNEVPVNGTAIREVNGAMARYQAIVNAAAVALGAPPAR